MLIDQLKELVEETRPKPLTIKEAKAITNKQQIWCADALKSSWWVRLRHWCSLQPILWIIGKSIWDLYSEKFPNERVKEAFTLLMTTPIMKDIEEMK